MSIDSRKLILLGGGLLIALLLGESFSPSVVSAACGDYVHFGKSESSPLTIPLHEPASPCRGYACSVPEQLPLAPPVVPTAGPTDLLGQLLSLADTAPLTGLDGLLSGDVHPVSGLTSSIFHPPR